MDWIVKLIIKINSTEKLIIKINSTEFRAELFTAMNVEKDFLKK